jgi:Kdo2-lipid IVA lauroyltransferase/acyltransferase
MGSQGLSTTPDETRALGGRAIREPSSRPWTARAARFLLQTSSRCPLSWLHAAGRGAARLGSHLPLRATRVAETNVSLCFPDFSPRERTRFVRSALEQATCMAIELGHLWLRPVSDVLGLVREVRGEEHLEAALRRGRGVILASPHLGAWELAGLWFATHVPMTTLYRAPRVREMEPVYSSARRRSGATLVSGAGGVRALYEALGRGEVAALLPDQDPRSGGGIFAPFFGVPANTSTLLPRIAARSRASVLFTYAERLSGGTGFCLHIRPGSEAITSPDLEQATRALNQDIEASVRTAPHQYLWTYKRFRVRPPGCKGVYRSTRLRTRRAAEAAAAAAVSRAEG